jgi:hypothetical protein
VGTGLLAGVIILVTSLVALHAPVVAGELECIDTYGASPRKMRPRTAEVTERTFVQRLADTYRTKERVFEGNEPCDKVRFSGRIAEGDFDEFLRLLKAEPQVTSVRLNSPGGSVAEAMKIGRLLRKRFVTAEANNRIFPDGLRGESRQTCGGRNQTVCCASACAWIYFGAAQWLAWDWVGLHRPTSQELGTREYSEARELLKGAEAELRHYFQEMEVDERIFLAMMSAPPSKIAAVSIDESYSYDGPPYRYPPSIHDWLFAKCGKRKTREEVDDCMLTAFGWEQRDRENTFDPTP